MPYYGQFWHPEGQQGATFLVASADASDERKRAANWVCDGTADEYEINLAIATLPDGGGKVVLTEGPFKLAVPIAITRDFVTLEGQASSEYGFHTSRGRGATHLYATTAIDLITVTGTSGTMRIGTAIGKMTVYGSATDNGKAGITVTYGDVFRLYDLQVEKHEVGIDIAYGYACLVRDTLCILNGTGLKLTTHDHGALTSVHGSHNDTQGFLIDDCDRLAFQGCMAKGGSGKHSVAGFKADGERLSFTGCHSFENDGTGFELDSLSYSSLIACDSYLNVKHGINIAGNNNVISGGCQIRGNDSADSNTYDGVRFYGHANRISDNIIRDNDHYEIYDATGADGAFVDNVLENNSVLGTHTGGTIRSVNPNTKIRNNQGHTASGDVVTIFKVIDHAALSDNEDATADIEFDDDIPAGSIIKAIKCDFTEAFNSDDTSTVTVMIGYTGTLDAFNKTGDPGEDAFNHTTDVFWGESACQDAVVVGTETPLVTFTEDDDGTDIINSTNAAGAVTITITYMKA